MMEEPDKSSKKYSYCNLYRFSRGWEWVVLLLGLVFAICSGACIPLMSWQFGTITNTMVLIDIITSKDYGKVFGSVGKTPFCLKLEPDVQAVISNPHKVEGVILHHIRRYALIHAIFAFALTLLSFGYFICFYWCGERLINRLSIAYFEALLRKDMQWLETKKDKDFTNDLIQKISKIRAGIGEQLGMTVGFLSVFAMCLAMAFYNGWKLSLVAFTAIPVLVTITSVIAAVEAKQVVEDQSAYSKVGSLVEEVLLNIRTVIVYQGQALEFNQFQALVDDSARRRFRHSLIYSLTTGLVWFVEYGSNSLCYWYGTKLVLDNRLGCTPGQRTLTPGDLVTIGDCMIFAAIHIGLSLPLVESIMEAHQCAKQIFPVIDVKSEIDSLSSKGVIPDSPAVGRFEFTDIRFSYPARKELPILKGVSFSVEPGSMVALVGKSGSGKSTILKLISKEYSPDSGVIKLDGRNMDDLNISWLRSQMSVVTQESGLFDYSIEENVRMGRPDATYQEIVNACRAANAHEFISQLPEEYQTEIGFQGSKLSGGERQRISIARALIRRPHILLLDEITSALDFKSEAVVQEAIRKASKHRTTFIIAHRLKTITAADQIIVFDQGTTLISKIAEQGTHTSLLQQKGIYFNLVNEERQSRNQVSIRRTISRINVNPTLSLRDIGHEYKASKTSIHVGIGNKRQVGRSTTGMSTTLVPRRRWRQFLAIEEKDNKANVQDSKQIGGCQVLKLVSIGCVLLTAGVFASMVVGSMLPIYGMLFGELMGEMSNLNEAEARKSCAFYSMCFALTGTTAAIAVFTQSLTLSVAGSRAVSFVRKRLFFRILRQDASFFENPANKISILTTRLSHDAGSLNTILVTIYGAISQSIIAILMGIGVPMYFAPRLTGYSILLVPIVLSSAFINGWLAKVQDRRQSAALDGISKLVLEVFHNKHVVTTCQLESYFIEKFKNTLKTSGKCAWVIVFFRAVAFGVAQASAFWTYSIFMYIASIEITQHGTKYKDALKVGDTLIFGLLMVGGSLTVLPSFMKAMAAGKRIIQIIKQKPVLDYEKKGGMLIDNCMGNIEFNDVHFHYPNKPEREILKGISFTAKPGQLIALVGSSGSGKSTCIALMIRFYDITTGSLTLDSVEYRKLNCGSIRSHIALVQQTPRLFDRTLAENIAYGDNSRDDVTIEEIIDAAKAANIHTFIKGLPEGYQTKVGSSGSFLSGGQLQKIAIARALLNPDRNILILDEATSALDTESEKVVMEAIEAARVGRTCIAIAHRLLSIKNADLIVVMQRGEILESGTHEELLLKPGLYAQLWKSQNLDEDPEFIGDRTGS